jgi:TRAP-type C4-dicarboxylate transport system permease small subunit
MYAIIFCLLVALFTMFMLYKSIKTDMKRYKTSKAPSIIIGWSLFTLTAIFFIIGVVLTMTYGRVAPFDV